MTWALLLATARRLPWALAAAYEGRWAKDVGRRTNFEAIKFPGKRWESWAMPVGRHGCRIGQGLSHEGYRLLKNVTPAPGVELVDVDTLLRQSDVLSIHVHRTEENRGLIDRKALAMMQKTAIVLNTSRGAIIDQDALLEALKTGRLSSAGWQAPVSM